MNSEMTSKPVTECQICSSKEIEPVIFIGFIPPVNTMPRVGSIPVEQEAYPLQLLRCKNCSLVQIGLEVDAGVLFPPSYPYRSRSTRILREDFADLCAEASELLSLKAGNLVIDVGSNDGTLLTPFQQAGYQVLGIEPSDAGKDARKQGIDTITAFFGRETASSAKEEYGQAHLVTAANVFAHIGDIHSVVDGVVDLLGETGVFVSESHYLLSLIETLQYDTIYHEHLRHYSLGSLKYLLESHGLEVFHVKRIPTHGGSIRVYAAAKDSREILPSVAACLQEEEAAGITDGSALATFSKRVMQSKLDLMKMLADCKREGATIYGIGAPSRASTLINYIGLDDGIIDCVMEIGSSPKINKYVPGTRIPVLDEEKLFQDQPEYALLLSWHITEELITNLRRKGYQGRFIVPLPEPHIING